MLRTILRSLVIVATVGIFSMNATRTVAQSTSASQLQSLVNETAFQLQLSYRSNLPELERRREEVAEALTAWNQSARTTEDSEQLSDWLHGVIRASLPGSQEPLPPLPDFQKPEASEVLPLPPPRETPLSRPQPSTSDAKPHGTAPSGANEQTLMRPTSIATDTDETITEWDAAGQSDSIVDDDFWSEHPATTDLPEDLSSGDPFLDDPLPSDDDLFFE